MRKHECAYHYCTTCGFLQTEEPYWLAEAYDTAIADGDTGLVQRNILLSQLLSNLLYFCFDARRRYLDVAGGYGMLTRLMRDTGFDFFWADKYCENLMARGFEAVEGQQFAAVTAFEVLEHVPDPLEFIREALDRADARTIVFSTELFEGEPPGPDAWWYYAFETGQHIGFYQRRTLDLLGQRLGLRCLSNGSFHVLTDASISPVLFTLLTNRRIGRILSLVPRVLLESKTMPDHRAVMGQP